jgi:hypothetical protein
MSWALKIQTKSGGDHEIDFGDDEAEAKAALQHAHDEWEGRRRSPGTVAFEERVIAPRTT